MSCLGTGSGLFRDVTQGAMYDLRIFVQYADCHMTKSNSLSASLGDQTNFHTIKKIVFFVSPLEPVY